jgi:5-methylcytosine-specific restriction endonuclease McrA
MTGEDHIRTLLLSQSYEPLRVISWKRAFTLLTLGKVEVVEEYDRNIRTCYLVFKMPAVVRLIDAFRRHRHPVRFSRVNVYARDRYRCQYCGLKESLSKLTFDHVIPRSRGGTTSWTNVVAACVDCNHQKANRTPTEARMRLIKEPVQPRWVPAVTLQISMRSVPEAWTDYLYWTGALAT